MERPTNSAPFGTTTRRVEPVREDQYAELLAEWLLSDDVHESYRLRSLLNWHLPVPWAGKMYFHTARKGLVHEHLVQQARTAIE